jgi:hypothetical protein
MSVVMSGDPMRRVLVLLFIMVATIVVPGAAPATAQISTLDAQRANAGALFDRRLDALSAMRAELSGDVTKYERACRGKVTTGRGIGAVFLGSELVWLAQALHIDNETTPECRILVTGIKMRSQQVSRELEQIDEDARRRGIYPGVMRDLKRGYRFE